MSDWAATLGVLLRERGADLFGYACLFAASDREAEALLQEAIARTFRSGRSEDLQAAAADVKRAIASSFVATARRSPGGVSRVTGDALEQATTVEPTPASDPSLRASLLTLPPLERACVVLHYLDDLPVEDIASLVRLPQAAVERHVADGVATLHERHPNLDFTEVFTISVADGRFG